MIQIREGIVEDLPQTLCLVKELAEYEKSLHEVSNTVEQMKIDGFGNSSVFGFFVADEDSSILGISIYYFRYSTWKGKRLYLEDIVVTRSHRGKGIGNLLFERTMQHSIDTNCTGMMWQVLDWNESAINFYKKYNTKFDSEWINCHLENNQIDDMLRKLR